MAALKPLPRYNNYDCEKDPHHLFSPLELARLAVIDRRIDSIPPSFFDGYDPEPEPERRYLSDMTPEERLAHRRELWHQWCASNRTKKLDQQRRYREGHREELRIRNQEYRRKLRENKEATNGVHL